MNTRRTIFGNSRSLCAIVMFLVSCCSSAQELDAPTQVYRFHLGSCYLGESQRSYYSSGRPEVRIEYQYSGVSKKWSSITTAPNAKGFEYSFDMDVDLPLDVDSNSKVHIQLVDVGKLWNNVYVDRTFPASKLRESLPGKKTLTNEMSRLELCVVDPPGRYEVNLLRTQVSPEDFEAIGGRLPKNRQVVAMENVITSQKNTFERYASEWLQQIKESDEKFDHLVVVERTRDYQKEILFDSYKKIGSRPQGLLVAWNSSAKFEIDWKAGDKITVRFQDWNIFERNITIVEQTNDSDSSISLLQGVVQGGKQEGSRVLFKAHRLEGR